MVLSVQRFTKFYSKIENHYHHRTEALQAFRSDISTCITQLLYNLKSGFELNWIHQCFQILPAANKAFAKLVVEIDYHDMTNWKAKSMEDYLNYSLELLDHFNSINSSISHLNHARLSMLHALSLLHTSPSLAAEKMERVDFLIEYSRKMIDQKQQNKEEAEKKESSYCGSDKESLVLQAMIELRSVALWVCRVVLAILSGDEKVYTTTKSKSEEKLSNSNPALINLDSRVCEIVMKKGGCVLKEVTEMKQLSAAIAGGGGKSGKEAMEKKLEEFEKQLNDIGKQVERVFSDVLAGRNELLNGIRFRK